MWNTRPNNGRVPMPFDQPASNDKTSSGVYLAKAVLSRWCRLHKTSRHSELDCPKFQTVAEIFQVEVQNAVDNASCRDIVPSEPYDSSCLVVNQAPFPRGERNKPEVEPTLINDEEAREVSNEQTLAQLFYSVDNGLIDEEESFVDEVHMFH